MLEQIFQFLTYQARNNMADLMMIETGDGGDGVLNGNDLLVIDGFQNMPYIGMFGGNPEGSTSGPKEPDEESLDWWGNSLLMPQNQSIQFNSLLEKKLETIALTSSGRLQIISTIKEDLDFMNTFTSFEVNAVIVSVDRVNITIKIFEPDNLESNEFTYIWDATNSELTLLGDEIVSTIGAGIALNNLLNFEL